MSSPKTVHVQDHFGKLWTVDGRNTDAWHSRSGAEEDGESLYYCRRSQYWAVVGSVGRSGGNVLGSLVGRPEAASWLLRHGYELPVELQDLNAGELQDAPRESRTVPPHLRHAGPATTVERGTEAEDVCSVDKGLGRAEPASAEQTWEKARSGEMLFGWADILEAMGVENSRTNQRRIKRFQESLGGPIRWQGNRPVVDRGALLAWWREIDRIGAEKALERRTVTHYADHNLQADEGLHEERRPNAKGQA